MACSCVDCDQSCPIGQAVTVDDTDVIELFGIKVLLALVFSAVAIITLVATACILVYIRFPGKKSNVDTLHSQSVDAMKTLRFLFAALNVPNWLAGTEKVDKWLTIGFKYWGRCK